MRNVVPDQACEERNEAVTEQDATLRVLGRRVTGVGRDLDGGDGFAARDSEDPCLVRERRSAGSFGAVEARALGGPHSLVAELRVADVRRLHGEEKLDGDAVHDELVVRKERSVRLVRVVSASCALSHDPLDQASRGLVTCGAACPKRVTQ